MQAAQESIFLRTSDATLPEQKKQHQKPSLLGSTTVYVYAPKARTTLLRFVVKQVVKHHDDKMPAADLM